MTMSAERARSLRFGHEMLTELDLDKTLPEEIKSKATSLLATYPSPDEVNALVLKETEPLPTAWVQAFIDARALLKQIQWDGHGNADTRRAIIGTLRHFPEEWMLNNMLKSKDRPASLWLEPEATLKD